MKRTIHFLGTNVPLTKHFYADGTKSSYPMAKFFTSYSEEVSTPDDMLRAIKEHAKKGHCLLKGALRQPLNNESRQGSTRTDDPTSWICLDFDRYETPDLDEDLAKMGMGDVSYVIQYSSSHGLDENMGTVSAHVFMLLNKELPATTLKAWLMDLNMQYMPRQIKLARSGVTLSWPLDVTTCQNDKLLYIAPPTFEAPRRDPLGTRIQLVKKKRPTLDISTIGERVMSKVKLDARKKLNEMRALNGLPARRAGTTWKNQYEIEKKPDVCEVTGIKDCGDYIRLNINGGDSWAYWHPADNFEIIHDFKSDTHYLTKEFVPEYYRTLMEEQAVKRATPTENGDLILAFRDLSSSEYYNGIWNPETQHLQLYRARNETQLDHWMKSHGLTLGPFIPTWRILYDPRADWIVDEDKHLINTFRKSKYMTLEPNPKITPKNFPNIYHMVRHFLGEEGCTTEISAHFLNWLAVIFQRKAKPRTAWVNHGVQGTGKGYFMSKVITPLFGKENVAEVGISNIEDQFNGWQEGKLFINVNEIDVEDFTSKGRVEAKFKTLITDDTMPVRRMRQTMSQEPNYGSYLFSSNKKQPVMIPSDDRRYNVGNRQGIKLVPPKEEDVANELEAFAQWLLAHRADVELSNRILQTEARAAIQRLGVSSIEETCNNISEGLFDNFWMNMVDEEHLQRGASYNEDERVYNNLIKDIGRRIVEEGERQTLSRDEIGIILRRNVSRAIPCEPNKLTSLLRHNGIYTKQVRHKGKKTYGVHVIWHVSEDILKEIKQELDPKLKRKGRVVASNS